MMEEVNDIEEVKGNTRNELVRVPQIQKVYVKIFVRKQKPAQLKKAQHTLRKACLPNFISSCFFTNTSADKALYIQQNISIEFYT